MDPDRYQRVKEAFAAVSGVPSSERAAILRRVCGDDVELRREVEALLAHDRTASDGLLGDVTSTPRADSDARPSSPSSTFAGDFAPGEVLIGRYRVVALVGEGGMGEVYRADDLVLGQPVALKFLPERLAKSAAGLERFRAEVRHAREVSHPNVARVHDIGEVDGRHFLTMEYVDGEDLASLIKRIGRLPHEKASEIAQQVCSALAEAHRKGVLHRDLKPANVMLDGNGQVRLTDFGLAIVEEEGASASLAGTPQYMAPEQLAGVPASIRSEVYSLGLLLYELYTGRRALRGRTLDELRREHEDGGPDPPSSHLADLDPTVDTVLRRCLARLPEERPSAVREIARALPGGDPLAAALAAGETPAPSVVAAAEAGGGLTAGRGRALLGFGAVSLVALVLAGPMLGRGGNYGEPPAILRERARELAIELSGEASFAHEIHWYERDEDIVSLRHSEAAASLPPWNPLLHHSRFGPEPFVALRSVSDDDPVPVPGSAYIALDAQGVLLSWSYRIAGGTARTASAPEATVDWEPILRRAGFDPRALEPTEPTRELDRPATEQRAWTTKVVPGADGEGLRIEAAGDRGRPVVFEVMRGDRPLVASTPEANQDSIFLFLTAAAALVAWRNVRSRRADVRGALQVGGLYFFAHCVWIFSRPMPDELAAYAARVWILVHDFLGFAVSGTLFYLALEPLARKRWPHALIAWNRILGGRARDARVGREVLVGIVVAPATMLVALGARAAALSAGFHTWGFSFGYARGQEGPLQILCNIVHAIGDGVFFGTTRVFILVLLRSIPRLGKSAHWIWLVVGTCFGAFYWSAPVSLVFTATELILLTRLGLASSLVAGTAWVVCSLPLTLSPNDWTFPSSFVVLTTLTVAALWAYREATRRDGLHRPTQR